MLLDPMDVLEQYQRKKREVGGRGDDVNKYEEFWWGS